MRINYIVVDDHEIIVGATDNERWQWEIEDGRKTGVDAKTLVMVSLKDQGQQRAIEEQASFYVAREDPLRDEALLNVAQLLDAAWMIHDKNWNRKTASDHFMGKQL